MGSAEGDRSFLSPLSKIFFSSADLAPRRFSPSCPVTFRIRPLYVLPERCRGSFRPATQDWETRMVNVWKISTLALAGALALVVTQGAVRESTACDLEDVANRQAGDANSASRRPCRCSTAPRRRSSPRATPGPSRGPRPWRESPWPRPRSKEASSPANSRAPAPAPCEAPKRSPASSRPRGSDQAEGPAGFGGRSPIETRTRISSQWGGSTPQAPEKLSFAQFEMGATPPNPQETELRSVQRVRQREGEGGDGGVELAAVGAVHLVGAVHRAARRLEHAAARVLEVLAGPQHGLLPDDARARGPPRPCRCRR